GDAIRLFDFHADFLNPVNSSFTERDESPLATAPFDPTSSDGRSDIFQSAPGEPLDSQSDRLMYRAAYRNFGTHESLVFNQTVRTSVTGAGYRAGVRVYELRKSNGAFGIREQATVGNDTESRWMGSAAQDYQGNIALGYSFGNHDKKPSVFYSGKLAVDPGGTFRREAALIDGTGVQSSAGSRWGDYSAMSVDPSDDCTFWMTNQYYAAENPLGWLTRIGKFKFAECSPAPRATINGVITNSSNNQPIDNALVTANTVFSRNTNSNGDFGSFLISPDTYVLTASAKGFRSQTHTVSASNGQLLIQNFALEPTSVMENAGTKLIAESCAVNNSAEPGETVTINIALRNTGARNTASLTAVLQPTGDVKHPSKPQNYGVLPTGGNPVLRSFTFTASTDLACGEPILLTFNLQDGAENLGMISVILDNGTKRVALQENFDSVIAPNLPNGWTTGAAGAQQNWTTASVQTQSAPNSAFSPNPNQNGINELVSPVFQIVSPNAEISFRNWYELESTFLRNKLYDGSVLEIEIGNNDWQDIEAAGGAFISGGYDGVLDGCCQNPLAGRRAWSGKSGVNQNSEFIVSKAKLPASASGNSVRLRWRVGTDIGSSRQGQYIDDLLVSDGYVCSCRSVQKNRAPFDFDGDGKTDLSVFRPTDDASKPDFLIQNSSENSSHNGAWGSAGDIAVSSDYDGDGKTDFAVFRPSTRIWFILNSSNFSITTINFGLADDKLTPADYDGDGKSDISVFRPSTGTWYRLNSSNKQLFIHQFGTSGDDPVQADYDGDNKADLAVFRPSDGVWYVLRSSDDGFSATRFGSNGDKPIAGDYDGDEKADFAVFRPSDRNWYLLQSSQGFKAVRFGLSDDKILQSDFDGDKRNDIAVFRPANNVWYYLKSSNGDVTVKSFGEKGDTPLPS
ncbi:MAG TPA: FG-GAP-like repeat-containing protein, partial [Pyrinomonadaceae bacterium]